MGSKYYYLVAGLPELTLEDSKLSYTVADFKTEIYSGLSASDQKLIDLFYLKFDNANVLKLLKDKEAEIDKRGNYSAAELTEYISILREGGEISPKEFPSYLSVFISDYLNTPAESMVLQEDHLAALYYEYAMKCGNKFVSSWFEFNLNINNILVAFTARKFKWDIAAHIVGNTEVCEALRTSSARDFGLSGEVDVFESLVKISEITELVEREKKLDALRWNWMEDAIFFDYFTVERIFAFLLKLEMIERWISLDKERGNQLFRSIIESLKNEVCYISTGGDKLMAEVIKVVGANVYVQVFESTRGLKVGAEAEFTGHMLEVTLGPGMLSKNYDGLQNDLDKMDGVFLKRGQYTYPLDKERIWHFVPMVKAGDKVVASAWLGQVDENFQPLKIMAPFTMNGTATVKTIMPEGDYKIEDTIAILTDEEGNDIPVTMIQKWPVKRAMTNYKEKPRPFKLLETGVRVIDTLNPIVEGGTGFIPGPFGTGKTVLQHAISKQAEADIVIIAACGERANEVVEIFTEFPELVDPHTGRKLMERTIIIANTSNMPVAAREASVYTAMSLAEYYRSMGLKVLLMADSTSRWAQALREMSNRMEELPGPDAFPMDISAIISNFYGRAGYVKLGNDETGSITFIGTVSPAGGNLKEPVTENTKKVARCFYALEQDRADKKRYPAVNPIDSYSKYIEYPEFEEYIKEHINDEWIGKVNELKTRLQRGKEIAEQINILGDDGVPVEYHVIFWKSELIDFVILQQDAFDEVDSVTPMERQEAILNMIIDICHTEFEFDNFNEVMDYFKRMINVCKQMNYSKFKSEQYEGFQQQLKELIAERSVK